MAENFPILMSHTKTQIQEAQKTKKLKKKSTPRYVLFQLEKKNLEGSQQEKTAYL